MDKSLFKYIWQHSRRDQIAICAIVILSLPFYYLSLDLPRRIINEAIQGNIFLRGNYTVPFLSFSFDLPSWLGGAHINIFDGFTVDRTELLFGLSFLFLFFVLVNGAFKYWINLAKGALGERMMRRMRYELFNLMLRIRPEMRKRIKSAEMATIIKDEVEPIGGFIGDAFVLPIFLGAQAATALIFIIIQNKWLGLMAATMVGIQLIIIPRLRRKLLVLGRERQLESRRLAGKIGEVFEGHDTIRQHDTVAWERAEVGNRLYGLFNIRYQIYKRKFLVKFINNLLAQITPFFFYAIGGYFAVTGRMDIGQLVAVIGAYRDLPPPLKDLIDWDQQRLDVTIKYDQIVQQFATEHLLPETGPKTEGERDVGSGSSLIVSNLTVPNTHGGFILNELSFELPLPARVALICQNGIYSSALARVLGQPNHHYMGEISLVDVTSVSIPLSSQSLRCGCVTGEPTLFSGTIRSNLVYGLQSRLIQEEFNESERQRSKRRTEARKTANPLHRPTDLWIDYDVAGVRSREELDHVLLDHLHAIGLGDDIYQFGQFQTLDPRKYPLLAERFVEARLQFHQKLQEKQLAHLIESFSPELYNTQATIAENLLFGTPSVPALTGHELAMHSEFCGVLNAEGLFDIMAELGLKIAETMVEIFWDLTPNHPLFEKFSFFSADDLDDYEAIVGRWAQKSRKVSHAEKVKLVGLALNYVEPRHRLGLLNDQIREAIVKTRLAMREMLEAMEGNPIEFYEKDKFCYSASLHDNLLFGKINASIADARSIVSSMIRQVVEDLDLRSYVERLGLNQQVGTAGRLLTTQQRIGIDLVRNLVKRPDFFVVDGAFASFPIPQKRRLQDYLLKKSVQDNMTLIIVIGDKSETHHFDYTINLTQNNVKVEKSSPSLSLNTIVSDGLEQNAFK